MAHQIIRRALRISGATIHWYDKPGRYPVYVKMNFMYHLFYSRYSLNSIFPFFLEMRKQRKMGHITIVGPSMSVVEARVKSMLKDETMDNQPKGLPFKC